MNLTIDQMKEIVEGAPKGAEFCWFDFSDSNDVWYYKDEGNQAWGKNGWGFCNDPQFPKKLDERLIKLSDLRAAIASNDKTSGQATVAEVPGYCEWTADDEGNYSTACGNRLELGDGLPSNFKYCPYCGNKIKDTSHD